MPYAESPFHLNFLPEFPELSVEWFTFGKFNKFFANVLPGISIPFEFSLGISGISEFQLNSSLLEKVPVVWKLSQQISV